MHCHPEPRKTARDLSNMVEGCELGCVISYRYVRSFACAREDGLIDTSFAALESCPVIE